MNESATPTSTNFVRQAIQEDLASGRFTRVHTRFPPEPNGYLHIGHAKAFCLDFGLADEFGGLCNLRLDDTNPVKEDTEYVDAIQEDLRWMGCDWEDRIYYASDYFETLYGYAVQLIEKGLAYVCELSPEDMRKYRGTLKDPGTESPYRSRSVEENLDLFARMRAGEFANGAKVLRARIDMAHPNLNMRDPVLYRILKASHHRTGDKWCIYPTYDFAHGQSDSVEGITFSICTLEFEDHRPLYDWFCAQLGIHHPRQIEFARLNLSYTVMSKRKLLELVKSGVVNGWDDPRLPTLCGMRRRGYTPEAIRSFLDKIGVTKYNSITDIALLEHCLRDDLNRRSVRVLGVMDPIRVIIDNYPEGATEYLSAVNNPEDPNAGTRDVPFSRELFIEREDFMEDPPKKFFRLAPGAEVRLRYGYFITCQRVVKDDAGQVLELHCTYDPQTRGGQAPDGRKVKGTLHWVSAAHAITAEVRLYDRLFKTENPDKVPEGGEYTDNLNPDSLTVAVARVEPYVLSAQPGDLFQFERVGYFCVDKDSDPSRLVFNRTVTLKDSWSRTQGKA
jgi:glutaminyl-tRNA synthetase